MDLDQKLEQRVQSMMVEVDGLFEHRDKLMADMKSVSEELKNPALDLDDFQIQARREHLRFLHEMAASELQVIIQRGQEMGRIFDAMYQPPSRQTR